MQEFLSGEGEKKGDSDGRRGWGAGNLLFTKLSCTTLLQIVNVTLDQPRRKMNNFNPILHTWFGDSVLHELVPQPHSYLPKRAVRGGLPVVWHFDGQSHVWLHKYSYQICNGW